MVPGERGPVQLAHTAGAAFEIGVPAGLDGELEFFGLTNTLTQQREHWTLTPRLVGALPFGEDDALITAGIDWDRVDYDLDSRSALSTFLQESEQILGEKRTAGLCHHVGTYKTGSFLSKRKYESYCCFGSKLSITPTTRCTSADASSTR